MTGVNVTLSGRIVLAHLTLAAPKNLPSAAFRSFGLSPQGVTDVCNQLKSRGLIGEAQPPVPKQTWGPNPEKTWKVTEAGKKVAKAGPDRLQELSLLQGSVLDKRQTVWFESQDIRLFLNEFALAVMGCLVEGKRSRRELFERLDVPRDRVTKMVDRFVRQGWAETVGTRPSIGPLPEGVLALTPLGHAVAATWYPVAVKPLLDATQLSRQVDPGLEL